MNRSKELSCAIGVHTHDVNGKTVFMPCKTHDEYEEAIKDKKAVYFSEPIAKPNEKTANN